MTTDLQQGSHDWLQARLGYVTASRFADVLTPPKAKADKDAGNLSQTAERYMRDLLGENLTGLQSNTFTSKEMEWGKEWEPHARTAYEARCNIEVQQVGFITHPLEDLIGGSPDGLVGDDGIIEIKCPFTLAQHVLAIENSVKVIEEHIDQIQGNLWITGRQWCDFISYHPHFPAELQLFVVRVPRDVEMIGLISTAVTGFRDKLRERFDRIIAKAKAAA